MTDEFEFERAVTRDEAATVLHEVADAVASGAVLLGSGDEERTVDVPGRVELEVEFETEDDEMSLEVELEWPDAGAEGEPGEADATATDSAGPDSTAADTDPEDPTADSLEEADGVPTEEPGPIEADHPPTREGVESAEAASAEVDDPVAEGPPEGIARPADGEAARQVSLGRFELFEDRAGEWRWRLVHRNGNVIATSGEGYTRKQGARKGLRSVMRNAEGAEVTERPDE